MVYIQSSDVVQSGPFVHSWIEHGFTSDGTNAIASTSNDKEVGKGADEDVNSFLGSNYGHENVEEANSNFLSVPFKPTPAVDAMVVTTTTYATTVLEGKSYVVPYVKYLTATPTPTSTTPVPFESSATSSLILSSMSTSPSSIGFKSSYIPSTTSSNSATASSAFVKPKAVGEGRVIGIAVGSVVGALVLIIGIGFGCYAYRKKHTKKRRRESKGKQRDPEERPNGLSHNSTAQQRSSAHATRPLVPQSRMQYQTEVSRPRPAHVVAMREQNTPYPRPTPTDRRQWETNAQVRSSISCYTQPQPTPHQPNMQNYPHDADSNYSQPPMYQHNMQDLPAYADPYYDEVPFFLNPQNKPYPRNSNPWYLQPLSPPYQQNVWDERSRFSTSSINSYR